MKHILIVEDEYLIRTNLKEFLELEGYLASEAGSGAEGLQIFQQEAIDLVVSDVVMPQMDGFELCRRIRGGETGKLIPFIFLSAQAELSDVKQGYKEGADEYLIKPCTLETLTEKIEMLLGRNEKIHREIRNLLPKLTGGSAQGLEPSENGSENQQLSLTFMEERICFEVLRGRTNEEIAELLMIGDGGVEAHLQSLLDKLNLEDRSQLIELASKTGYKPE